jgi:hypothetical protein
MAKYMDVAVLFERISPSLETAWRNRQAALCTDYWGARGAWQGLESYMDSEQCKIHKNSVKVGCMLLVFYKKDTCTDSILYLMKVLHKIFF